MFEKFEDWMITNAFQPLADFLEKYISPRLHCFTLARISFLFTVLFGLVGISRNLNTFFSVPTAAISLLTWYAMTYLIYRNYIKNFEVASVSNRPLESNRGPFNCRVGLIPMIISAVIVISPYRKVDQHLTVFILATAYWCGECLCYCRRSRT